MRFSERIRNFFYAATHANQLVAENAELKSLREIDHDSYVELSEKYNILIQAEQPGIENSEENELREENKDCNPEPTPAENLPEGWHWMDYGDGSGSLRSPTDEHFFSYDLSPYHASGGIEYKKSDSAQWSVFWGPMSEFKTYAESAVNSEYLPNQQSEQELIEQRSPEVEGPSWDYEP